MTAAHWPLIEGFLRPRTAIGAIPSGTLRRERSKLKARLPIALGMAAAPKSVTVGPCSTLVR